MMNIPKTDPTPKEIAEMCLEIQAGWTEDERLKRIRTDWRPTFRRCDGQRTEFAGAAYEAHHSNRAALTVFQTR